MTVQTSSPNFIGAIQDPANAQLLLSQIVNNSQSAAGGLNFVTSSGTTATVTNLSNALLQYTAGSATTVTLDYAYNIGLALPMPLSVGQKFGFMVATNASTTIATPTLSDTAVTLAGTTSVLAAALRWYQGVVTQVTSTTGMATTAGTTFTSLTQVGSTNAFTVALGTNAISPTVGQLINLNVTSGTLPSGWYPIVKVTSATSFIIATPAGTVWTATAATVGTSTVAPATYSPLITITGMMATVTATMSV
jgi:hypothetical protein